VERVSRGVRNSGTISGRAFPGTDDAVRGDAGAVLGRSLELQQKGFGEEPAHPRGIEPGGSAGGADEADSPAHAELTKQIAQLSREACQGIEDMRQTHQEVVAPHGIPVEGKGMLVVVALVLFDEEARFDAPAVASAEIAALMDILAAERLAGEPGVARRLGHDLSLLIDPLPAFLTDHHVQFEMLTPVRCPRRRESGSNSPA
jgi:hypothetical protein